MPAGRLVRGAPLAARGGQRGGLPADPGPDTDLNHARDCRTNGFRWMGIGPGVALPPTVCAFDLLGDATRDPAPPSRATASRRRAEGTRPAGTVWRSLTIVVVNGTGYTTRG